MATKAWPYAVTRGETSGYQAIVVPSFLEEAGHAYVLEYASRQEDEPGTVTVRDVIGISPEPLCLAYRVTEARADLYGLGGAELLEDGTGRTIRVFEGLVLRVPAERVPSIGLTAADLDVVTGITVPAFRKLWKAGTSIDAEPSTPISVGGASVGGAASGPRFLNLQIAEPYVVPGARTRVPRTPHGAQETLPVFRSPGRTTAGSRSPRSRVLTAIGVICVLAVLLGWYLTRPSPPSSSATVSQLCADLSSGKTSDAYQEFSDSYRDSHSLAAFKSSLLGSATSASCTSKTIEESDNQATLSLRLANGSVRRVHLDLEEQTNQWQVATMTVSR